jgi:hypothetical protein
MPRKPKWPVHMFVGDFRSDIEEGNATRIAHGRRGSVGP